MHGQFALAFRKLLLRAPWGSAKCGGVSLGEYGAECLTVLPILASTLVVPDHQAKSILSSLLMPYPWLDWQCLWPGSELSRAPHMSYGATGVLLKMRYSMVIVYPVAALIGALISCVLFWPHGAAIALLSMPFGGSLLALLAALLLYMRSADEAGSSNDCASYMDQSQKLQTTESRR
jgi:hypothetical protein